ncbi:MAG: aldehyde dehydrogenase family protein [bacterium]|nr:MAG: aldehyde dehydrogenase family protein [bacterium]
MDKPYYLAGTWGRDGEPFEVRSPGSGEVVGTTYRPGEEAVEQAVEAAVGTFMEKETLPCYRRVEILRAIAGGIEQMSAEFAEMIAREVGKPIRTARGEVSRAVQTFNEAAEECSRLYGEVIPLDVAAASAGRVGITRLMPLGPVLAITPFNFPLNLVAHKLAPAIAAGCTVVLKPSSEAPLTSLLLADVIDKAGLPAGSLSVLPLAGNVTEKLAGRPGFKRVTFTGSADVGWRLKIAAWDKKVTLELGGNAAVIVHEDWPDLEGAARRITMGGYAFAGQVCISVQRIYIHERSAARFVDLFVRMVKELRVGDPLSEETDVGPMITEAEAERVERWVDEAIAGGARALIGGRRNGVFYEPSVLDGVLPGMKVAAEEIFGPVTCIFTYSDFGEALEAVNDSRFGLQAGIYTKDIDLVCMAFDELDVGGVIAGDVPTFRVDRMPYGGVKASGTGREGLRYAIREMCEPRLLVIAPGT